MFMFTARVAALLDTFVELQRIDVDKAKVGRGMIGCPFRGAARLAACFRPYLVT
jgi:hypothetical protein